VSTSAAAGRWRTVDPSRIERALAELWLEAAQDGPLSRAVMSNLVVVRPNVSLGPDAQEEDDSDIVRIAQQHPARTILLAYSQAGRAAQPAHSSIGVVTFGAGGTRYGVEIIEVEAACTDQSVPSIVRRLARGDVPTTIWWAADLSAFAPTHAMLSTARQFLYDSASWRNVAAGAAAVAAIAGERRPYDLEDLNWRRLAPLRSAIAHTLTAHPGPSALAPADVVIRHRPGEASAAWLLAAWFCCRLKWQSGSAAPTVEESRDGDDLVSLVLWPGAAQLTAAISRQRVKVKPPGMPLFRVPVPHETPVDAVVAALRSRGRESCLAETVATLAEMIGQAGNRVSW
jgi:glucose-6-phosphate dehydrogenase assembly protein OpcA